MMDPRIRPEAVGLALVVFAACGPSVVTPDDDAAAGGSSGAIGTDATSTTRSGPESEGVSSTSAEDGDEPTPEQTSSTSSTTGPTTPPPTVLGAWVCVGEWIPFALSIETVEGQQLTGTACAPSDQPGPPAHWDDCDAIGNHPPVGFQYQVLAAFGAGDSHPLEFGFNHHPDTDTLEGLLFSAEPPFETTEQSCVRQDE